MCRLDAIFWLEAVGGHIGGDLKYIHGSLSYKVISCFKGDFCLVTTILCPCLENQDKQKSPVTIYQPTKETPEKQHVNQL